MTYNRFHSPQDHVCGCYVLEPLDHWPHVKRVYLPQVGLVSHVTVRSETVSTVLTQTYVNPTVRTLKEIRYSFPLYDGVSVVEFTCKTGSRTIKGVVKSRDVARATFNKAVDRGETAGLLEQLPDASDIFTTSIGNIERKARVEISIKYIGELKHDAEVDGLRLTIPTAIAPRYGNYPGQLMGNVRTNEGMQITVDAEMTSAISKIQSPSHSISMSIGTISTEPNADPVFTRASATLSQGSTELDRDIIIQIISKDIGTPRAILESHPTIPGYRAISATLVPNFLLKNSKCEVIFVADRSGSMQPNVGTLRSALKVALKSLPLGTHFNICSFGSSHSFLWPKSRLYSQETLDEAMAHVGRFQADFGGTEMFSALSAAVEARLEHTNTEILLLTDGEIYAQQELISYLTNQVKLSDAEIRLFTLGIGDQVSHSLIEGVARAGNGVSQSVTNGEKLDGKMMRLLKCALSSHTRDYSIEINCQDETGGGKNVVVEKVSNTIYAKPKEDSDSVVEQKPAIPLFTHANVGKQPMTTEARDTEKENEDRYSHLPQMSYPDLLQAPRYIPPLFSLNRTTVYLLMSPDTAHLRPLSVTLRGKSQQGPLELEIPIKVLEQPSATIHQLAAKKAIQELEEGYGWLTDAQDQNGKSIVKSYPHLMEEIVEREAVRLGVTFQVSGKGCSFVAVETDQSRQASDGANRQEDMEYEMVDAATPETQSSDTTEDLMSYSLCSADTGIVTSNARNSVARDRNISQMSPPPCRAPSSRTSGSSYSPGSASSPLQACAPKRMRRQMGPAPTSNGGIKRPHRYKPIDQQAQTAIPQQQQQQMQMRMAAGVSPAANRYMAKASNSSNSFEDKSEGIDLPALMDRIVATQTFQGTWQAHALFWKDMSVDRDKFFAAVRKLEKAAQAFSGSEAADSLATVVVVLYLGRKMPEEKDIWDLMVEKARAWLSESASEDTVKMMFDVADGLVGEH